MEKTEEIKTSEQGYDKSGPYPKDDLVGRTFGRLIVRRWEGRNKGGKNMWLCECECDKQTIVAQCSLKRGLTESCGCLRKKLMTIHGYTSYSKGNHPLYQKYSDMKQRCYNINNEAYKNYGGRGIKICDEWLESPESFIKWCLQNGYNKNLSIERIDNNKDYSPENCCFATRLDQNNNTRSNRLLTHEGKTQNMTQWAREIDMNYQVLRARIYRGWSVEDALSEPTNTKYKNKQE